MGANYTEYSTGNFALNVNVVGASAGSGIMRLVASSTIAGAAVSIVTFSGLSINTSQIYQLWFSLLNPTAGNTDYYIFINADTTATNYYSETISVDGVGTSIARVNAPRIAFNVNAGRTSFVTANIMLDPSGLFRYTCNESKDLPSNVRLTTIAGAKTAGVADITSISIASVAASGIGVGSKFLLYGT